MSQEGVIKYNCNWIKTGSFDFEQFEAINYWRNCLYELGLIGVYGDGLGYGNLSFRVNGNQYIITGSATGGFNHLTKEHYTKVISYNLETNSLTAQGPIVASSESLTHAAIYQSDSSINAVFHGHHMDLWEHYLHKLPTSDVSVEYGTISMAHEIIRLYAETDMPNKQIMIMGGHKDGIISFGKSLDDAGYKMLKYYKLLSDMSKELKSVKEIKQNGNYEDGSQSKLHQKIEEIAMYVISQQKQIEELTKEIKELKK